MKIQPNLTLQTETRQGQPLRQHSRQNFKGAESIIVPTMDFIDNGGLAVPFILQDFLGSIAPRTVMGGLRGKKENGGKTNTALALKEFLREIITGPSMFLVPMAILAPAKKYIGKALDVPADFIDGLSKIYEKSPVGLPQNATAEQLADVKKSYYTQAFKTMLDETTGGKAQGIEDKAKVMADHLLDAQKAETKAARKESMGKLTDEFVNFVKSSNYAAENPEINFLNAYIKKCGKESVTAPFDKAVVHLVNYTDDVVNEIGKAAKTSATDISQVIKEFATKRKAGRLGLNLTMAVAVTAFLTQIPKIYNRTKENPALIGLDENVTKDLTSKKVKGDKNASK